MKVHLTDQEWALREQSRSVIYRNDGIGLFNKGIVKDAIEHLGQASTKQVHSMSQKMVQDYVRRRPHLWNNYKPSIEEVVGEFSFGERTTRRMLAKLLRQGSIYKLDHGWYCSKKFYEQYQAVLKGQS